MGTQPEDIERALQGRRTLPTPGQPNQAKRKPTEGKDGRRFDAASDQDEV